MNKQTEALKMVLEFCDNFLSYEGFSSSDIIDIQNACKEALEQPAQEPVAWMSEGGIFTRTKEHAESWSNHGGKVTPVYTHPAPSWQGLSDAVVMKIVWDLEHITDKDLFVVEYYRAIELALKEKNHG